MLGWLRRCSKVSSSERRTCSSSDSMERVPDDISTGLACLAGSCSSRRA
jgi:hypothetical protein